MIYALFSYFFYSEFAFTQLSHSPMLRVSIERPLILDMVRHVLSNPDTVTLFRARNLKCVNDFVKQGCFYHSV